MISNIFKPTKTKIESSKLLCLQVSKIFLSFIISVFVARYFGAEKKGVIDLFILFTVILANYGLIGTPTGFLYFLSNKNIATGRINASSAVFALILNIVYLSLYFILNPLLKIMFVGVPEHYFMIVLVVSFFYFYKNIAQYIMIGLKKPVLFELFLMINQFFILSGLVILFYFKLLTVKNFVYVNITSTILLSVISFIYIFNQDKELKIDTKLIKISFKTGLKNFSTAMLDNLYIHADKILIAIVMNPAAVGFYTISAQLVGLMELPTIAVTHSTLKNISSADPIESWVNSLNQAKKQLLLNIFIMFLFLPIAYFTVNNIYGDAFKPAFLPILIIAPSFTFWLASRHFTIFYIYNQNRAEVPRKISLITLILNIFLNYIFLWHTDYGINGVAFASAISYILYAYLLYSAFKKDNVISAA